MSEYLKDFTTLSISKSNLEVTSDMIPSILAKIILDKTLVHPNIELRPFANKIGHDEYKDYLFGSRTALFARLTKDAYITPSITVSDIKELQNIVSEMLLWNKKSDTPQDAEPTKEKPSKSDSPLKQWKRIIEEG
jgi:hypothetical protein